MLKNICAYCTLRGDKIEKHVQKTNKSVKNAICC